MTEPSPAGWRVKVLSALILVLFVAVGARVVYELLSPAVPAIVALIFLIMLFWLMLGRKRR